MEQLCRICHGESEENRPLYFPCKCDGSIKFIHQDCLLEWMRVSGMNTNSHKCELCGEKFQFQSIYSTGEPPQLTVTEFVFGLWPMVKSTLVSTSYNGMLAVLWLVVAPFLISWFLDISCCVIFRKEMSLLSFLSISFRSPVSFVLSWWNGALVTSTVLVSSCTIYYLYLTLKSEYHRRQVDLYRRLDGNEANLRHINAVVQEMVARRIERREEQLVAHRDVEAEVQRSETDGEVGAYGGGVHVLIDPAEGVVAAQENSGSQNELRNGSIPSENVNNSSSPSLSPSLERPASTSSEGELIAQSGEIEPAQLPIQPLPMAQDPDIQRPPEQAENDDMENLLRGLLRNVEEGADNEDLDAVARDIPMHLEPNYAHFFTFLAVNVIFIISFAVLPVLIGRTFLSVYSIPPVYFEEISRRIGIAVNEQRILITEFVVIFDLSSSVINVELTEDMILNRVMAIIEAIVGFCLITSVSMCIGCAALFNLRRNDPAREIILMFEDFWQRSVGAIGKWTGFIIALGVHLVVLPQIIGWLIDIALLPAFNATIRDRIMFTLDMMVLSLIVHWLLGLAFMVAVSFVLTELREIIRHDLLVGILPSFHREDDNAFDLIVRRTLKENLSRSLMRTVFYTIFVLLAVSVPVQIGHYICPCLKPLTLNVADAVFEIQLPLEMVFLHVLVPLAMDHLRIKVILHEVMTNFFCILCSHLEISEILEHPPAVQVPVSSGVQQDYARSRQISYSARVCLCMLAFMLALAIAASWIVHAPLTLGRGLFIKLGFHVDHDAFNYIVGAVMVFVAVKGSRSLCRELDAVDVHRLATVFAQWIAVCLKVIAISSIWLTIIPLLIGIGFESIAVVPLRTSPNETPRYPVLQCWALGLVFLKIWMRCVFLGGENHWRPIFERVLVQGFWHMNMSMIFREIVFPVLIFLADFVLVPYFVTRLAGVLLDLSYEYRSFLVRFSFIGFAITRCIINGLIELVTILTKLHNSIRDSRYLVGTQLTNRGD